MNVRPGLLLCAVLVAAGPGRAEEELSTFSDPALGFSVAVPALGDAARAPSVTRLLVSGPPIAGFATNCNVQVQRAVGSHAEFVRLSLEQFAEVGWKVVERKDETVSGRPATRFEYAGSLGGRDLRFAALAVTDEDRVFLLTCTTPAERWAAEREELLAVLDSFVVSAPGAP